MESHPPTRQRTRPARSTPWALHELQTTWHDLNHRYFESRLPTIPIVWSARLTASIGMFVSRGGPRSWASLLQATPGTHREIRLSLPLFRRLAARTATADRELLNTLAHEMIHQWQYDILKRRPNHGTDFLRKMTDINCEGLLGITRYHTFHQEVEALARYTWHCRHCGASFARQRHTINPRIHRCGTCKGHLDEVVGPSRVATPDVPLSPLDAVDTPLVQLSLPLPF